MTYGLSQDMEIKPQGRLVDGLFCSFSDIMPLSKREAAAFDALISLILAYFAMSRRVHFLQDKRQFAMLFAVSRLSFGRLEYICRYVILIVLLMFGQNVGKITILHI